MSFRADGFVLLLFPTIAMESMRLLACISKPVLKLPHSFKKDPIENEVLHLKGLSANKVKLSERERYAGELWVVWKKIVCFYVN